MFGGRRNNNNESLSSVLTPEQPKTTNKGSSVTGFDPEGLERAAKAARELDASRNASSAIELIKTQEVTKQVRMKVLVCSFWVFVGWQFMLSRLCHTMACTKCCFGGLCFE
jgi:Domain of unknown function (DUF3523)